MLKELILASRSPQRRRILQDMQLNFKCVPADIDEHHSGLKRPHAIVKKIAERKAFEVAQKYPDYWVLGCDTIVVHNDGVLSLKPKDRSAAKETLKKYSDSYCDVYSGLSLTNLSKSLIHCGFERTRLHFRSVTGAEIEDYLNDNEWAGSSGSMTIEGRAGEWIKKIDGEYWNVVGLPVELLKEFLTRISAE